MKTTGSKKKNKALSLILTFIGLSLLSLVAGWLLAKYIQYLEGVTGYNPPTFYWLLFYFFVIIAIGIPLQVIIHELGHLFFGLLTGYKFASFRVGDLTLVKQEDGFAIKRFTFPGAPGQCLLFPPDLKDGKIPYLLYNLGGVLFNFLSALVAILIIVFVRPGFYAQLFLGSQFAFALFFGILNTLPLKALGNDGYVIRVCRRDPAALRALWAQLKIGNLQILGHRSKDIPVDLFQLEPNTSLDNMVTAAIPTAACDRLMDSHEFEAAEKAMVTLLESEASLHPLHQNSLKSDLMFCRLIRKSDPREVTELLDDSYRRFAKAMASNPSVLRTEYALARLHQQNDAKAAKILHQFKTNSKDFLYQGVIPGLREQISLVDEISKHDIKHI